MHTTILKLQARPAPSRPEISVYWKPGCSMCLRVKEFLEEQGIPFESLNVMERDDAMDELVAAGVRGLPVVRRGAQVILAQSLDDLSEFVGASGDHNGARLSQDELLERWDHVLAAARKVISGFDPETLEQRAIPVRERTIKELSAHVFQIPEAFLKIVNEGVVDTRDIQARPRANIVTRSDLLSYIDAVHEHYRAWRAAGGDRLIGDHIETFWGRQPAIVVLERFVWHSTQHTRQLDIVAAGRAGAELQVAQDLYARLPLPARLWA